MHMTLEQRGLFITVVAMIYAKRGPIPNDPSHIGRAANCSSRMARSIIAQLVANDDLQIEGEMLHQKRAMEEIFGKLSTLENAAKGGRTRHENRRESLKNNSISSAPTPPHSSNNKPLSNTNAAREEVFRKGNWNVSSFLSDGDLAAVRKAAPDWDVYHLASIFNENVNSGKFKRPDKPGSAFAAWARKYTKGKAP